MKILQKENHGYVKLLPKGPSRNIVRIEDAEIRRLQNTQGRVVIIC